MELLFEGSWDHIQKEMHAVLGLTNVQVTIAPHVHQSGGTHTKTEEPKVEKPKATKATAAAAAPAPIVAPAPATPVGGFDFKNIEEIIPKALEAAGRGKVVTLLEKYGAKKGSELKTTDYEAFYNECQALLTAASLT